MAPMITERVFLVLGTHEVELPNHKTALENLDRTDPRLRVVLSIPKQGVKA